jgi:hypothetical protein
LCVVVTFCLILLKERPHFRGAKTWRSIHDDSCQSHSGHRPTSGFRIWSNGEAEDIDANGDGVKNIAAWVLGAANSSTKAKDFRPTLDHTSDPDFLIFNYRRNRPGDPSCQEIQAAHRFLKKTVSTGPCGHGHRGC